MLDNLKYMVNYDFLTNIYNGSALLVNFSTIVKWARENNNKLAVLFFDVDKFKRINDTYGHAAGDLVLMEVAARINLIITKEDILGRIGGDEFVVVKSCVKSNDDVVGFINEVFNVFSKPIEIDDKTIIINTSIGIAIFPDDAQDRYSLINFSYNAMHEAKKITGNSYKMYKETLFQIQSNINTNSQKLIISNYNVSNHDLTNIILRPYEARVYLLQI